MKTEQAQRTYRTTKIRALLHRNFPELRNERAKPGCSYLLVSKTGFADGRVWFMIESDEPGEWITYDRNKARRYSTRTDAFCDLLRRFSFPENYLKSLSNGSYYTEPEYAPSLFSLPINNARCRP